jgi:cytochrome c biogenesis protein CcmG, thiol:disulfide interchange protein DsbE
VRWKGALFLLGGLLAGVLLGLIVFFSGQPAVGADPADRRLPPAVGGPAQDFELPLLGGSTQKLSELRGKPVVINFWATWCGPCRDEMPLLERFAQEYAGQVVVLGVNSGEGESQVTPFVEELKITFPILLDLDEQVTNLYFVRNFPITFFVDAEGVVRAQHLGILREDLLLRYIETIGLAND